MNTLWNKIRYTVYTPIYDVIGKKFNGIRKRAIDSLEIKEGQKVLLVGAGTGLDIAYIPENCHVYATDLTMAMLSKIGPDSYSPKENLVVQQMNGQALTYNSNEFDHVVLHLILAVIPDPIACIKEAERVLKPGGKISVFDKFLPEGRSVSGLRRVVNVFANFLATNINRSFSSILSTTKLTLLKDENAAFNGNFRLILLKK